MNASSQTVHVHCGSRRKNDFEFFEREDIRSLLRRLSFVWRCRCREECLMQSRRQLSLLPPHMVHAACILENNILSSHSCLCISYEAINIYTHTYSCACAAVDFMLFWMNFTAPFAPLPFAYLCTFNIMTPKLQQPKQNTLSRCIN